MARRGAGAKNSQYRHGWTGTSLHNRWRDFRARCGNPKHKRYAGYGGRGITYADEWRDFEEFCRWALENGYRETLQLDRIDNDGPYAPHNCRWVTPAQNARNRRDNRRYNFFGVEMVIKDAANRFGLPPSTITDRIDRGWTPEAAVDPFCEQPKTKSATTS
jgi:hypothetical protein